MISDNKNLSQSEKKPPIDEALLAWRSALSAEQVLVERETINQYARDLIPNQPSALAILKPRATAEVQKIVQIANKYRIPLYPISKGKNWGYGAACPVQRGNVIVDLGEMNKIHEVNTEMAYCVVEPGVTQQDMYEYLEKNNIPLFVDVTGAPPESSLIGNTLERGIGYSRYSDHFATSCAMEVVLGSGELLKTGQSHVENAWAKHVFKDGLGPSLDGMLTQSNYGIVTKMTIWLQPKPEAVCSFVLKIENDENLGKALSIIRDLKMRGVIAGDVRIGNGHRMLSMIQGLPTDPEKYSLKKWSGSGGISGMKAEVKLKKAIIRKALRPYAHVQFMDFEKLKWAERFSGLLSWLSGFDLKDFFPLVRMNLGHLQGIPSRLTMRGTYLLTSPERNKKDWEPLNDGCGLYWHSLVIPAEHRNVRGLLDIVRKIYKTHQMPFEVAFHLVNERALVALLSITFQKNNPTQKEKAKRLYENLTKITKKVGLLPYRLGVSSMKYFVDPDDSFWKTTRALKSALDPNNIIAPGRYNL